MDLQLEIKSKLWTYHVTIEDNSFLPASPAKTMGIPENCEEGHSGEVVFTVDSIESDGGKYSDLIDESKLEALVIEACEKHYYGER